MQSYWAKAGYPIDLKPQIIGTLYQTGLFKVNGLIRIPRKNSIPNDFGEKVYYQPNFLIIFPNMNFQILK